MYECKWYVTANGLEPFGKSSLWRVEFKIGIAFSDETWTTLFSVDVDKCWSEEEAISAAFELLDQKNIISDEL